MTAPAPAPARPSIVVADDAALLREALSSLLAKFGFPVLATGGDVPELMKAVENSRPDIAVLDLRMPPGQGAEGLAAAKELRVLRPEMGLLLLSSFLEVEVASELMALGPGVGYLLKERVAGGQVFAAALERVAAGGVVLDEEISELLLERPRTKSGIDTLTGREREVLGLLAQGYSNTDVGQHLWLSSKTVEKRVHAIFTKLGLPEEGGLHRRVLAVITYLRELA